MVQFDKYPSVNNDVQGTTLYEDIVRHCKEWQHYADSSKYTTAHECSHGIANDLRLASGDWEKKNGFYLGKDRSILLDEPGFKKSAIIPHIPQELRSARYSLYVAGQQEWDDKPLYIYDEGVAYINGAWAAIELKEQENYVESLGPLTCYQARDKYLVHKDQTGNTIVDGHIEFIPYMTAVLITAGSDLNRKLSDFSCWLFRHAANAYFREKKDGFPVFDVQDKLYETMKTGVCYSSQREFLKTKVGFVFPDSEIPEDNPSPWLI